MDRQAEQRRYVVQLYTDARCGKQESVTLLEQGKGQFINGCLALYYIRTGQCENDDPKVIELAKEAMIDLEKIASSGDPSAQWLLGSFFSDGLGVVENQTKALELINKSATQGLTVAQCSLGWHYGYGNGVTKSFDTARQWFEKAIEQGDHFAMRNFGVLLSTEKKYDEALAMYQRAAAGGEIHSLTDLGRMYVSGTGVTKNSTVGLEWLLRGATAGDKEAQWLYGRRLFYGIDIAEDERVGFSWILKAAENGYVPAMEVIGKAYVQGWGTSHNLDEGLKWLSLGIQKGSVACMTTVGKYFHYGIPMRKENGVTVFLPKKLNEAVRLYRMGAEKGNVECEYQLGNCFYFGDDGFTTSIVRANGDQEVQEKGHTIERNYEEALRWYRLAATHDHASAQTAMGRCYARGRGVPVDKVEAKKWYKKAIASGDEDATKEMREELGGGCILS